MLTQTIQNQIQHAEARALATTGPQGVNVIPVSVVSVTEKEVLLYDFFMAKTAENLRAEPAVSVTAWTGLTGVQVQATAQYVTDGEVFAAAFAEMGERFPERTLKAVIVLTPKAVYDISAGEHAGTKLIG